MAHKVKPNRSIGEPAASPFLRVAASPFRSTHLQRGWVGEEAVALALYCFLRYPNDYSTTVIRAANTNGDSDSISCIAGSISGAYLGVQAIPEAWIERIEKADYLADLATRLEAKKDILNDNQ